MRPGAYNIREVVLLKKSQSLQVTQALRPGPGQDEIPLQELTQEQLQAFRRKLVCRGLNALYAGRAEFSYDRKKSPESEYCISK